MTTTEKNQLLDTLRVQTKSGKQWRMFAHIIRKLYNNPSVNYYVDNGNIYITKGNAHTYPCIVAHMDSVHCFQSDFQMLIVDDKVTAFNRNTMTQVGIGGDDKVGIFIALYCLEYFDNIKIAFFRDEEIGCIGSSLADVQFFDDCRFVLQCDRRGNSDFINNASGVELNGKSFRKAVKSIIKEYGYNFGNGMMTDVMMLKELGIACSMANMSCGYYNPHCDNEYVSFSDVSNCLAMVIDIISNCTHVYHHKYSAPKYAAHTNKPMLNYWEHNQYSYASSKDSLYCKDCWSQPIHQFGLCKSCSQHYADTYGLNSKAY